MDRDAFSRAEAALFRALGDETRVAVLEALRGGRKLPVSEICSAVERELSLVSHHLACLRNCGLVTTERHGKNILYSLNGHERIENLLALASEHVVEAHRQILECREVAPTRRGPQRRRR